MVSRRGSPGLRRRRRARSARIAGGTGTGVPSPSPAVATSPAVAGPCTMRRSGPVTVMPGRGRRRRGQRRRCKVARSLCPSRDAAAAVSSPVRSGAGSLCPAASVPDTGAFSLAGGAICGPKPWPGLRRRRRRRRGRGEPVSVGDAAAAPPAKASARMLPLWPAGGAGSASAGAAGLFEWSLSPWSGVESVGSRTDSFTIVCGSGLCSQSSVRRKSREGGAVLGPHAEITVPRRRAETRCPACDCSARSGGDSLAPG